MLIHYSYHLVKRQVHGIELRMVPSHWELAKTRDQKVDPSKVCSDATY